MFTTFLKQTALVRVCSSLNTFLEAESRRKDAALSRVRGYKQEAGGKGAWTVTWPQSLDFSETDGMSYGATCNQSHPQLFNLK